MTDLTIALATASDLAAVMALVERVIDAMRSHGIDQWDDVYPTLDWFTADVEAETLWIAKDADGRVAGVCVVNEYQDPEYADVEWSWNAERVAVVHRLMVDPGAQGRGVARRLMAEAERVAVARGCSVVRLDAFSKNPRALSLYAGLGYRDAGEVLLRKGPFRVFEKRLGADPR